LSRWIGITAQDPVLTTSPGAPPTGLLGEEGRQVAQQVDHGTTQRCRSLSRDCIKTDGFDVVVRRHGRNATTANSASGNLNAIQQRAAVTQGPLPATTEATAQTSTEPTRFPRRLHL